MAKQSPLSASDDQKLFNAMWHPSVKYDPLKFVMMAFPWGKKGTPLEHELGPRQWQSEYLTDISKHLREQLAIHAHNTNITHTKCLGMTAAQAKKIIDAHGLPLSMYSGATASGRGIGKSALVAWLINWFMSCFPGSSTIVTANTETQLKSRTWAEFAKWQSMAINAHWWDIGVVKAIPQEWFAELLKKQLQLDSKYYYAEAQVWSEQNPDAFAGAHNTHGMQLVFDEASGIPENIWSVSRGFFTEPTIGRLWHAFSNPRRPSGAFYDCFHKDQSQWRCRNVDSRTVEGTDPKIYQDIIDKYGLDSDEARVEVYGQFPNQGDSQFIARDTVQRAVDRPLPDVNIEALIMSVDVARKGKDATVIGFRRGRDARSYPITRVVGLNNVEVAHKVAELADRFQPDRIVVDGNGPGGGVVDVLRAMKYSIFEFQAGEKAFQPDRYNRRRTEVWAMMKDWLIAEGCIPDDQELRDDLTRPDVLFDEKTNIMVLESKKSMKSKGLDSTDTADMLSMTFAVKMAPPSLQRNRVKRRQPQQWAVI